MKAVQTLAIMMLPLWVGSGCGYPPVGLHAGEVIGCDPEQVDLVDHSFPFGMWFWSTAIVKCGEEVYICEGNWNGSMDCRDEEQLRVDSYLQESVFR